jgi:hypothetical protein
MQSLMNLAMQRTQLNFRKDEAETARKHAETMQTNQQTWAENMAAKRQGYEATVAVRKQRDTMGQKLEERRIERQDREALQKKFPGAEIYQGQVIRPQKPGQPQKLETWVTPKGKIVNLPPGEQPPRGSRPWYKPTAGAGAGDGAGGRGKPPTIEQIIDDTDKHYKNLSDDLDRQFGTRMQTGEYNIDRKVAFQTPWGKMTYDQAKARLRAEEIRDKRMAAHGDVPAWLSTRERILEQRDNYIRSTIDRYRRY